MLGDIVKGMPATGVPATAASAGGAASTVAADQRPRTCARDEAQGRLLRPVSGRGPGRRRARGPGPGRAVRHPVPVSERPDSGELAVDGASVSFGHPADAIRAGLVYVPADRAEALLMQRSVRENIALPFTAPLRSWGLIDVGAERRRVKTRRSTRLQIDTRAQGEVRRLSGGNQQKVTIARWVAGGVRTMLCFDPTRGIDIGTKRQIYELLRDLAGAGAAVLLYTSELKEVQLACDRSDRHLQRAGRRRDPCRGGRRGDAPARRVRPAAGCRDARGRRRDRACRGGHDMSAAEWIRSRPPVPSLADDRVELGAAQPLDGRALRAAGRVPRVHDR